MRLCNILFLPFPSDFRHFTQLDFAPKICEHFNLQVDITLS
jgi:hypothetical protein